MNPLWLARNVANSWNTRASIFDFVRRLLWVYGPKLPGFLNSREWTISFRYPPPVGRIKLLLRANGGSDAFIHGEVFEHNYYRLPLLSPPETILDLGANVGLTAVYFGRLFPNAQVACVEPVPVNVRLLEKNLELNSIKAAVISAAVDVADGHAFMEIGMMDYGHRVADGAETSHTQIRVPAISVPTLCRNLGWKKIGLLKMDIEGHEKALFESNCDWLACVDAMCIEWHDDDADVRLQSIADQHGFARPQQLPGIWFLTREIADVRL